MDERLNKLHEMVNKGIDEITAKGSFDKDTVCLAGQLIDIQKDISTIEAMEESGYSEMYPMEGTSYARRGRDGRFIEDRRRSYDDNPYIRRGRSSYVRGYSRAGKEEMIESLEEALEKATNEQDRESIRRLIAHAEG